MPILGICGDSYMSATTNGEARELVDSEGKHFTEILAKKLGYEYFTLARSACSNFAIRMQIGAMIDMNVDLVIAGWTTPDRIEFPNIGKEFEPGIGVYNLDYSPSIYPDKSALNKKFQHNLISETMSNIFHTRYKFKDLIGEEKFSALENYCDHLYDFRYKILIDSYIIDSGAKALQDANIPFIFTGNSGHPTLVKDDRLNPWFWEEGGFRRWHTTDEAQEKGANLWYEYLLQNNMIRG